MARSSSLSCIVSLQCIQMFKFISAVDFTNLSDLLEVKYFALIFLRIFVKDISSTHLLRFQIEVFGRQLRPGEFASMTLEEQAIKSDQLMEVIRKNIEMRRQNNLTANRR